MPTIIILIVIMTSIAYATLVQANNSLNLSYKQSYIQMAREASKAAIDYAQEQFDNANCGNYSGTGETSLTGASNSRYRVTMQADVQNTSTDGFEKTIIGTGRLYLPKASSNALYVFDIRSEIVRTYAVCKTPDNFAPLAWYDASNINTLKGSTTTTTVPPVTTYGTINDSTRDTLEERADNGTQTLAAWQSNDFEMHDCDASEFSTSICNSNSTKYLNDGMIFSSVNIPKNSVISSATIKLACATPAGSSGTLNQRIYGFYKSASSPHPDLFTQGASNQLKTPLSTAALHTSAFTSVSSNNCPPGNQTVFDVTSAAQEIVNNPNWDPTGAGNGGRMGFAFTRSSGSGSRHLLKTGNQLSISYSSVTASPVANTGTLFEWDDISGNGNHARSAFGTSPTRQDNQINGKTVVRFNNGSLLASLVNALSGKREMTVFAVLKPTFTGGSSGRVVSGMSAAGSSDTSNSNSIIPMMGFGSGFSNSYDNNTDKANVTCSPNCANLPTLVTSLFNIDTTNDKIKATIKVNGGALTNSLPGIDPGTPPPKYTYSIDQLYLGGTRSGAGALSSGYFNGDYGEIVVYDHALSCHEIEDLEEYFHAKWAIAPSQWISTCPPDNIPTL
ncbi:MAG: hypothetical protein JWO96_300 [Candidatus Saccharibacteria bacterium]|nr:hypothetical protein [Candidatus Saccharibacteria bacterium]